MPVDPPPIAAEPVGSGPHHRLLPPPPPPPKFPNNATLVLEEEHADKLKALLPILRRHKCLEDFSTLAAKQRQRSPWVKAFVDLYHTAGPWGPFSNTPEFTSNRRYNFKSYQIPAIFKNLKKYKGANAVHLDLREALEQYFAGTDYYRDYMATCDDICLEELKKPFAQRVDPTSLNKAATETETETNDDLTQPASLPENDDNLRGETCSVQNREERGSYLGVQEAAENDPTGSAPSMMEEGEDEEEHNKEDAASEDEEADSPMALGDDSDEEEGEASGISPSMLDVGVECSNACPTTAARINTMAGDAEPELADKGATVIDESKEVAGLKNLDDDSDGEAGEAGGTRERQVDENTASEDTEVDVPMNLDGDSDGETGEVDAAAIKRNSDKDAASQDNEVGGSLAPDDGGVDEEEGGAGTRKRHSNHLTNGINHPANRDSVRRRLGTEEEKEDDRNGKNLRTTTLATPSQIRAQRPPAVTPQTAYGATQDVAAAESKRKVEKKREELAELLSMREKRLGNGRSATDTFCQKIKAQIDKLEEELFELIMMRGIPPMN